MEKESRWYMYCRIQAMKGEGFSQRQVAKIAGYNRKTVRKYWDMASEGYDEKILEKAKRSSLEQHKELVLSWLREYSKLSAAQVFDWLQEKYHSEISESSVRRYIRYLRKEYEIKHEKPERDYCPQDDPAMGYQMQVDIGIVTVENVLTRKYQKLYCIAFVLSNSRYKYGVWYDYPPVAKDMVNAIRICFEWMGGKPKELVFDQDRLVAVDENYGDIIYTKAFEVFRQSENLKIYLCRGYDPESKGRVEAVVKFFKNNFARYRQFYDLRQWDEAFEEWLARCGNKKKHTITKKIPAEVFELERTYLIPIFYESLNKTDEKILSRNVRKDNTVFYEGNRYTLPPGTYNKHKEVSYRIAEGKLKLYDAFGDALIAEHTISLEKGKLVRNNNHLRNHEEKVEKILINMLDKHFQADRNTAETFLRGIKREKPRYVRDQFKLIEKSIAGKSAPTIKAGLEYCLTNGLFSAVDLRDAIRYFEKTAGKEAITDKQKPHLEPSFINKSLHMVSVSKRDISDYVKELGGGEKPWLN